MNWFINLLRHIFLPLTAGLLIYILFRENTWLHSHFIAGFTRFPVIRPDNTLLQLVAFNVPDFCWAYALASSLFFWQQWTGVNRRVITILTLLLLAGSECLQMAGYGFTFDWLDLVATILAFGLSYTVIYKYETF
ncbi:MAG: hypothetical protein J0M10_18560 [Chitinophagales bacterium]|nr:hypothetical protein [Chitinophagales bacterium]